MRHRKVLLQCERLCYQAEGEVPDVWEVSWQLCVGESAQWRCARAEQQETVWRLLHQQLRPQRGQLVLPDPRYCYSDMRVRQGLNENHTLSEALRSPRFETRPWSRGHRRSWELLADQLEISSAQLRHPLGAWRSPWRERALWLCLLCVETPLLLLSFAPQLLDEVSFALVAPWCQDRTGGMLWLGEAKWPLPCDQVWSLQADGSLVLADNQT